MRLPFVVSVGVSGSFEQMRMYVEVIPSDVADVMRNPVEDISERSRSINDSFGYEPLNDAIINAERAGACSFGEVVPENLLFVFGQTIQSIGYASMNLPVTTPPLYEGTTIGGKRHSEKTTGNNKDKPKHRAIVLCKLKDSNELEKVLIGAE
jgi:hypothetical protein